MKRRYAFFSFGRRRRALNAIFQARFSQLFVFSEVCYCYIFRQLLLVCMGCTHRAARYMPVSGGVVVIVAAVKYICHMDAFTHIHTLHISNICAYSVLVGGAILRKTHTEPRLHDSSAQLIQLCILAGEIFARLSVMHVTLILSLLYGF